MSHKILFPRRTILKHSASGIKLFVGSKILDAFIPESQAMSQTLGQPLSQTQSQTEPASQLISASRQVLNGNPLLVTIFLRGACDGLNFICPLKGEDRRIYELQRPTIQNPISGANAALALNDLFALHPAASEFNKLYEAKKLAFVHACGTNFASRSHFDSQNWIEWGTTAKLNRASKSKQNSTEKTGWMSRFLNESQNLEGPLGVGSNVPQSFLGAKFSAQINSLEGLLFAESALPEDDYFKTLKKIACSSEFSEQIPAIDSAFLGLQKLRDLESKSSLNSSFESKIEYPNFELSRKLEIAAKYAKSWQHLSAIQVDMGGWDTHKYQGKNGEGYFSKLVKELSESVSTFWKDMQNSHSNLTIVVFSEFGRRLRENANGGTDHGHGGVCTILGSSVQGGKVYGEWPGLKNESLFERADLKVTTNIQTIFAEVLQKQFKAKNLAAVFPELKNSESFLNILNV